MSGLTKRQAEIAEERLAEAQGREVRRCGACGTVGTHFLPEHLDTDGRLVTGRYVCEDLT